jgi:hypothetical protein
VRASPIASSKTERTARGPHSDVGGGSESVSARDCAAALVKSATVPNASLPWTTVTSNIALCPSQCGPSHANQSAWWTTHQLQPLPPRLPSEATAAGYSLHSTAAPVTGIEEPACWWRQPPPMMPPPPPEATATSKGMNLLVPSPLQMRGAADEGAGKEQGWDMGRFVAPSPAALAYPSLKEPSLDAQTIGLLQPWDVHGPESGSAREPLSLAAKQPLPRGQRGAGGYSATGKLGDSYSYFRVDDHTGDGGACGAMYTNYSAGFDRSESGPPAGSSGLELSAECPNRLGGRRAQEGGGGLGTRTPHTRNGYGRGDGYGQSESGMGPSAWVHGGPCAPFVGGGGGGVGRAGGTGGGWSGDSRQGADGVAHFAAWDHCGGGLAFSCCQTDGGGGGGDIWDAASIRVGGNRGSSISGAGSETRPMLRVGGDTYHCHGQGYASAGSRYSESAVAVEGGCYQVMGGGWSYYGGGPASRATGGGCGVLGASHDYGGGGGGGSQGDY